MICPPHPPRALFPFEAGKSFASDECEKLGFSCRAVCPEPPGFSLQAQEVYVPSVRFFFFYSMIPLVETTERPSPAPPPCCPLWDVFVSFFLVSRHPMPWCHQGSHIADYPCGRPHIPKSPFVFSYWNSPAAECGLLLALRFFCVSPFSHPPLVFSYSRHARTPQADRQTFFISRVEKSGVFRFFFSLPGWVSFRYSPVDFSNGAETVENLSSCRLTPLSFFFFRIEAVFLDSFFSPLPLSLVRMSRDLKLSLGLSSHLAMFSTLLPEADLGAPRAHAGRRCFICFSGCNKLASGSSSPPPFFAGLSA